MRLLLSFLALAAAIPACQAQTRPPQTLTPIVVSGKDRQVGFFYALNSDCSTRGEGDLRLIRKPEHGTVEFKSGRDAPHFPEGTPVTHCNGQMVPGQAVWYKSAEGYLGKDYFDVEFIGPRGADIINRYVVTVK
jgi:hypothetical protein